jgi:hypothetical protein
MSITVRSGGIQIEYTFLNFCRVVFWFYFGFVLFIFGLLLFYICELSLSRAISANQKHIGKCANRDLTLVVIEKQQQQPQSSS